MKKMCLASALAILLVLLLTACGGQTSKRTENVTSGGSDSANVTNETSHYMTLEETANFFADSSVQSYGNANATVSGNVITVNVWRENLSAMVSSMRIGEFDIENWATLKASFQKTADAFQDVLAADEYNDVHLAFNVLDDQDLSRPLLSFYDSEIVYDTLSE